MKLIADLRQRLNDARHARVGRASSDDRKTIYGTPLVSREGATGWVVVERNLALMIDALRRQTDPNWTALICGQDKPASVTLLQSDAPTEFFDKPSKLNQLAGRVLRTDTIDWHLFPLDSDDLPDPKPTKHMRKDNDGRGYLIDKGYMCNAASGRFTIVQPSNRQVPKAKRLYNHCGSSATYRHELRSGAHFTALLIERDVHKQVVRHARRYSFRLSLAPLHAMVYIVNHGENLRERRGACAAR